jgi:tRNA (guanine37-N1)-methyltransferase
VKPVRFDLLTVLPDAVEGYLAAGVLGRAVREGAIEVGVVNLCEFGHGKHRKVDDYPYGGGHGMVMTPEPLATAIDSVRGPGSRVLLMSPGGRRFDQGFAHELAECDHLVLVCGRYEGVDARILGRIDDEVSLGDFVLTGGELAALAVVDAVARLRPGVLGNEQSADDESFEGPLLEYPHYTRPRTFEGQDVPPVLLSGDHGKVEAWRREQAVRRTLDRRPDLLADRAALPDPIRDLVEALDNPDPAE